MLSLTPRDFKVLFCFARNDMNVSHTADELYLHRNTVTYRLDRIRIKTGIDPMTFYGLMELVTGIWGTEMEYQEAANRREECFDAGE